jgi:hypothetical protein
MWRLRIPARSLAALFALTPLVPASAQTGAIRGRVTVSSSGVLLTGVAIDLVDAGRTTSVVSAR